MRVSVRSHWAIWTSTPARADAVEDRGEDVEVIDDAVGVRQDRAGDAGVGVAVEQAAHEQPAGILREPAVDVGVVQVQAVLAQAAQVAQRDAELVGQAGVGQRGRVQDGLADAHPVGGQGGLADADDVQVAADDAQVRGRGDDVELGGVLPAQQGGQLGQGRVAGGQRRNGHGDLPTG
jgi:hypothetical protein